MDSTQRFVAGRGAERNPQDPNKIEKLTVRFNIGCLHSYSNFVQLALDFPNLPGADDDMNRMCWPIDRHDVPYYHPPSNYINEMLRRDFLVLDANAFMGAERGRILAESIRQAVAEWDPFPF